MIKPLYNIKRFMADFITTFLKKVLFYINR
nr:MAG TPA: hypothetical protein [Caudoviricetes sp.]